jgi:hypothetical protein
MSGAVTESLHCGKTNMTKCPFCAQTIKEEAIACQLCGGNIRESKADLKSIYYCPLCKTEDTYCDSTNRILCPHCGEYTKSSY